ncbi:hypothetical protein [Bradyrhizobium sp. AUGA SZCCT0283]|uniref:hypothetical protein n=1 Tax=Bradyrhizobium sp. AUGA SZCCT0283 TaxID=2807671 RepID=UPI002011B7E9|nr:hypothetical protein [Bradyrhizobium sp. AUGA SZCCT0283]
MRTLLIGVLAATLVGCSCLLPPQASMEACTDASGSGCLNEMAVSRSIEPTPASSRTNSAATKVKSTIATKTEQPSIAHVRDRPQLAEKKAKATMIEAKVEAPASGRPAETPDPVIIKAKTTIAAKLEDPASAEFGEMKRAIRKNTLGKSVDTICGRVKGKKASGEDTGDRPFLYLVTEDEAYVVDGPANSAAASAYRNICSS